jgi:hypothetical protein
VTLALLVTVVVGGLAGVGASRALRRWRTDDRVLTTGYGLLVAGGFWFVAALLAEREAEGMGGLAWSVLTGVLLWAVLVPGAVLVTVGEVRRRR